MNSKFLYAKSGRGEVNGQTTTDICTCDNVLAALVYCTTHECDTQARSNAGKTTAIKTCYSDTLLNIDTMSIELG
jgi:hypothetical protein